MLKKYRVRFWPRVEENFIEVEAETKGHAIYLALEEGTDAAGFECVGAKPNVWEARMWVEEVSR